ncbi:DUF4190 domain-containing protein [Agromyces protaetiae]|uniref:DUF4190 domain-containing protein n=1 Tax=Agromyces protaetiae TaxID=2509455 RepID=A0A4P6FBB3_9MICO|nr:DUF4190 domain-containing protein [Agromyces protaetiae]QAY73025.1 DUF4190 domain-containing protein [Agromyces protaetiae]
MTLEDTAEPVSAAPVPAAPDALTPPTVPTPPTGAPAAAPSPPLIPFTKDRGKVLGIVGLVLAFCGPGAVVGLVLSIVALVQSRNPKWHNGFALAGVIVSSIVLLVVAAIIVAAIPAMQTCAELGDGVHVVGDVTYTCGSTAS